jgi:acyl-CoA dehydrogenase
MPAISPVLEELAVTTTFRDSEEQAMLRDTVRTILADLGATSSAVLRPGDEETLRQEREQRWRGLAAGLGAAGTLIPAAAGGLDLTLDDVCVILEEMGRVCYDGPFLSTEVLTGLVLQVADQDVDADLAAAAEGSHQTAVTGLHHGPGPAVWPREVVATRGTAGWTLDGHARGVVEGYGAQVLFTVAEHEGRLGVWAVQADAPGHDRLALTTLDLTRGQSDHRFSSTPARLVLSPERGPEVLPWVARRATVALAAEQVGAASAVLAASLEYARDRFQFGRAIGSFQAIKHRCVDMAIDVEGALASYAHARGDLAGVSEASGAEEQAAAVRTTAVAGAHCSEALFRVAGANLQIHGGIGMAWEQDCHVYLRRAKASERLFGTPAQHRAQLVRTWVHAA